MNRRRCFLFLVLVFGTFAVCFHLAVLVRLDNQPQQEYGNRPNGRHRHADQKKIFRSRVAVGVEGRDEVLLRVRDLLHLSAFNHTCSSYPAIVLKSARSGSTALYGWLKEVSKIKKEIAKPSLIAQPHPVGSRM